MEKPVQNDVHIVAGIEAMQSETITTDVLDLAALKLIGASSADNDPLVGSVLDEAESAVAINSIHAFCQRP
jgi:hypothetical protein